MPNSLVNFRNEVKEICLSGNFITSDGFMNLAQANDNILYWKRDFLFRGGSWRGSAITPLIANANLWGKTLITGHSDQSLAPHASVALHLRGLKQIWGSNVVPQKTYASPIPLGLTNYCDDSPLHRIYGDSSLLQEATVSCEPQTQYRGSIYVNFTVANAVRERNSALKAIRSLRNVTLDQPKPTREGRLAFLRKIREHDFVLAPPGNGLDTHRFWEALYLGSIPITRKTPITSELATDLPCVLVDRWEQLAEPDFLESRYEALTEAKFEPNKLEFYYWKKLITLSLVAGLPSA